MAKAKKNVPTPKGSPSKRWKILGGILVLLLIVFGALYYSDSSLFQGLLSRSAAVPSYEVTSGEVRDNEVVVNSTTRFKNTGDQDIVFELSDETAGEIRKAVTFGADAGDETEVALDASDYGQANLLAVGITRTRPIRDSLIWGQNGNQNADIVIGQTYGFNVRDYNGGKDRIEIRFIGNKNEYGKYTIINPDRNETYPAESPNEWKQLGGGWTVKIEGTKKGSDAFQFRHGTRKLNASGNPVCTANNSDCWNWTTQKVDIVDKDIGITMPGDDDDNVGIKFPDDDDDTTPAASCPDQSEIDEARIALAQEIYDEWVTDSSATIAEGRAMVDDNNELYHGPIWDGFNPGCPEPNFTFYFKQYTTDQNIKVKLTEGGAAKIGSNNIAPQHGSYSGITYNYTPETDFAGLDKLITQKYDSNNDSFDIFVYAITVASAGDDDDDTTPGDDDDDDTATKITAAPGETIVFKAGDTPVANALTIRNASLPFNSVKISIVDAFVGDDDDDTTPGDDDDDTTPGDDDDDDDDSTGPEYSRVKILDAVADDTTGIGIKITVETQETRILDRYTARCTSTASGAPEGDWISQRKPDQDSSGNTLLVVNGLEEGKEYRCQAAIENAISGEIFDGTTSLKSAKVLIEESDPECPEGYELVDGVCVPITPDPELKITNLKVNPAVFNPLKNETEITFTTNAKAYLAVFVQNEDTNKVERVFSSYSGANTYGAGNFSIKWDGEDDDGDLVNNGDYEVVVLGEGVDGSPSVVEASVSLTVDKSLGVEGDDDDDDDDDYSDVKALFKDLDDVDDEELLAAIRWVEDEGIFRGYNDETFRPYNYINRAELTKVLMTAFDIPEKSVNLTFSDIEYDAWYVPFLETGVYHRIVNGDAGKNTFRPADAINRAETLKLTFLTIGESDGYDVERCDDDPYRDVDEDEWYADYVCESERYDLIDTRGNYFDPASAATRGEVSIVLHKMYLEGLFDR